jgi:hypothetical protein
MNFKISTRLEEHLEQLDSNATEAKSASTDALIARLMDRYLGAQTAIDLLVNR